MSTENPTAAPAARTNAPAPRAMVSLVGRRLASRGTPRALSARWTGITR